MNKVILIGRLVRDPEVRYTQGQEQKAIARFTLAVDRKYKKEGEQTADFISCIAFSKLGEFVEKYLKKGTKICLEGHWQTGSYKNKEDKTVYTNDCLAESIEFAESKKAEGEDSAPQTDDGGFMNIPDGLVEDLPFK